LSSRLASLGAIVAGVLLAALLVAQSAPASLAPAAQSAFGPRVRLSFGEPPRQPELLQVSGGEDNWHPYPAFRLDWRNPTVAPLQSPLAAAHFRVWNEAHAVVVPDTRIAGPPATISPVTVPDVPGVYTVEVWLEDAAGKLGGPTEAELRFDDARPGFVQPLTPSGWIGRTTFPYSLRLSHPTGPPPLSGIRGYAVSIGGSPGEEPCTGLQLCADNETDLRSGVNGDSLVLAGLPDGRSYVHAVAVSNAGVRSAVAGEAVLQVDTTDPTTSLAGAPAGWTNQPVVLTATAFDSTSGMQAAGPTGPFTAIRIDGAAPKTAAGNSVSASLIGEGTHSVAFYARDAAGNVNDGGAGEGMANGAPSTATVRIDRAPPGLAFADAQRAAEPELIEARLSDRLSGPSPKRGSISIRREAPGEQFEALPTEVSGATLRARWDSDSYPAGEYEFRAGGYDAAGNPATTTKRANGAAMTLSNPLKIPTSIESGFGGPMLIWHRCRQLGERRRCRRQVIRGFEQRPRLRLVPYGKSGLFSGRLTSASGSPLAQMPVQVTERFASGAVQTERVTTIQTRDNGIFTARLAPGPSRQVSATFAGTPTLTRSGTAPVSLGVRAGIGLRASAATAAIGGPPVVFSGKVEAGDGEVPADGKAVELQFRLPGLRWSEFRTIQTDAGGRFRYPYRFSDDDSRGVRFQFRAFAPAQAGWPYEPAASRPVAVRGR
jgi:hypothetical protein